MPNKEMSEWIFLSGTKIKAITFREAVSKLYHCKFSKFWAMEESPGEWTVLFYPDIEVHVTGVYDSFEASKKAISIVVSETGVSLHDVRPAPRKLKKKWCSIFSRECYEELLFG